MVTYPVGLGDNTIRILVTDDDGPETVVMATYTVYMYRENRPSLPMFGDHIMCSFVQVNHLEGCSGVRNLLCPGVLWGSGVAPSFPGPAAS